MQIQEVDFELYLGRPYEEYNCWTIIRTIFAEQKGIELPNDINEAGLHCVELWFDSEPEKPLPPLRPFDVLIMRRHKPYGEHVALMVDEQRYIHARPRTGTCTEPVSRWRHKILQVVRHKELQ